MGFGLGKGTTLESYATEWRSSSSQPPREANVESLESREWEPIPLSIPPDTELPSPLRVWGTGSRELLLVGTAAHVGVKSLIKEAIRSRRIFPFHSIIRGLIRDRSESVEYGVRKRKR